MEILEGGEVDLDTEKTSAEESEEEVSSTISHEAFIELATLDARIGGLKQQGFELREAIDVRVAELESLKEQLADTRSNLENAANEFRDKYNEHIEPLGIAGPVNISESEPHYVTARD